MKTYSYAVTVSYTGTFELEDDEAADMDEYDLSDYAMDWALDMPDKKEVDDVQVEEVIARV